MDAGSTLPILDLSKANDPEQKLKLLEQLHHALFNIGFLYVKNHGVDPRIISNLVTLLPTLFEQSSEEKARLSKLNSPHFLGYSGYAEGTTLGQKDLREQFDFATELPVIYDPYAGRLQPTSASAASKRDFSNTFWRLRGPNQYPSEEQVPGFHKAYTEYHDAVQELSYRFVHLVEEAFGMQMGTFDCFFPQSTAVGGLGQNEYIPPQHRIKLIKYPPSSGALGRQGVGAHKDSSGWLTFLCQVGQEEGLEVLDINGTWIAAPPIADSFVVNFGNAFEAATEGAVKATIHRVKAPTSTCNPRYSIAFFQGLPLDMTVSQIQSYIPLSVRKLRRDREEGIRDHGVSSFMDPRWDSLGESQLRKWIRSHEDCARKWYDKTTVDFYLV
ncbi:Clavaminate synthase-like protein [Pleomassaria siparia CBS 279.74]|uniref:Clavaminate synthase-like protein n=1 Tax=Pleomassaria siparia CBS 279.74 TaxID=1314801 RepID=A0A6G1KPN8_9PLEO|nr:Clavaminate synthase-like protein [Pleomassaria siparia CBS 279.74]